FFFSSRRRHTRSKRDWSSDVCSSDLMTIWFVLASSAEAPFSVWPRLRLAKNNEPAAKMISAVWFLITVCIDIDLLAEVGIDNGRSEERRVGKECRCRCGGDQRNEKRN